MSVTTVASSHQPEAGTASAHVSALAASLRLPDAPARLPVGEVVDRLGAAGLGLMLLALALPGLLPSPGLPVGLVFGVAVAVIGAQVMGGATRLALPAWLRRRMVGTRLVAGIAERGVPWLRRAERLLRPGRFGVLAGPRAHVALAVPILALGLVLALPIPFANMPPALALIAFALGLLERDGLAILIGIVIGVLSVVWVVALTVFGAQITGAVLGV